MLKRVQELVSSRIWSVLNNGTGKTLKSGQWEKRGGVAVEQHEGLGLENSEGAFLEQKVCAGMFHLGGKPVLVRWRGGELM